MSKVEPNRNVYIGHRYVPLLVGEWDNSNEYEGLSIVTYQGASYTSKKRTPVGIDILNEDYWVVTGNYNAQIEYYRDDVRGVQSDIETLRDDTEIEFSEVRTYVNEQNNETRDYVDDKISSLYIDVMYPPIGSGLTRAYGDGVTDDSDVFNDISQYCKENGYIIYANGVFRISKTVNINSNFNLKEATFITDIDNPLILGDENDQTRELTGSTPKIIRDERTWNDDSIGLKIQTLYESNIFISKISGFDVGLKVSAKNMGNVYNTYTLTHLENNRENLLLQAEDNIGWINENLFIGGRFSHARSIGDDVEGVSHIILKSFELNGARPNNNVFIKPSLEGTVPYYTLDITGTHNTIINGRYEGNLGENKAKRVIFRDNGENHSAYNKLLFGYDIDRVYVTQEGKAKWNEVIGTSKKVETGSSVNPITTYQNTHGVNSAIRRIIGVTSDPYDFSDKNYVKKETPTSTQMKSSEDSHDRISINHQTGRINFGDGSSDPNISLFPTNGELGINEKLYIYKSDYDDNGFRIGNNNIWVDGDGFIRYKLTSTQPENDKDGILMGTPAVFTAQRPEDPERGDSYIDKNLNKLIIWTGSKWVDAIGNDV